MKSYLLFIKCYIRSQVSLCFTMNIKKISFECGLNIDNNENEGD